MLLLNDIKMYVLIKSITIMYQNILDKKSLQNQQLNSYIKFLKKIVPTI